MRGAAELNVTLQLEELYPLQWEIDVQPRVFRSMVASARRKSPLETMGGLFGVIGDAGWSVDASLLPGPRAEHERATTYVDVAFWNRWWDRLHERGMTFMGKWHTHPFQAEPLPSHLDLTGLTGEGNDVGWFRWAEQNMGDRWFIEVIMAQKATRAWLVSRTGAWLVREWPIGISAGVAGRGAFT